MKVETVMQEGEARLVGDDLRSIASCQGVSVASQGCEEAHCSGRQQEALQGICDRGVPQELHSIGPLLYSAQNPACQ